MSDLTPRQREVASLYARGMSYKAIARRTHLSVHTVRNHLTNAADRIPGDMTPRSKLIWFFSFEDEAA